MAGIIDHRVYVISDLHLGGEYSKTDAGRGFRINTHVNELTEFVESLTRTSNLRGAKVELVINGDMVDFLAEKRLETEAQEGGFAGDWTPFTYRQEAACAKLQAIADRDLPFFRALGAFLGGGHRLTILTGNHDLELSLRPVRQKLREIIGVKPGHDYELISNGEAYSVGDALIEHGNRYDTWNAVEYDGLLRLSSFMSRKQFLPKESVFDPPVGSKLVSWVINPIKHEYKFIDLLKPETDVAVPFLLALEPGYRRILATVARLALKSRLQRKHGPFPSRFGTDIHATPASASTVFGSPMGAFLSEERGEASGDDGEAALEEILQNRLAGDAQGFLDALPPVASGPSAELGGDISTAHVVDRAVGLARLFFSQDDADLGRRLPALLKALQALQPDRNFDRDYEAAPEYVDAANELFDGGFRFVLFGHTHLAKKMELRPGCWYLNSGAWTDMIQLPCDIITACPEKAGRTLKTFVQDMATGFLKDWIVFRPTYLRLDLDSNDRVMNADLLEYEPAAVTF
jgi:UDP-2,3-diacylglucosamine pyrophosphatase LpxH